MYLFTGDAPVREFAAQFPAPTRLAIQLAGSRFLRSYPYQEAYLTPTRRPTCSTVPASSATR